MATWLDATWTGVDGIDQPAGIPVTWLVWVIAGDVEVIHQKSLGVDEAWFQNWVMLVPEDREGFEVTEQWKFELPLATWESPDHFTHYSFNMYFPNETQLDPTIPGSIIVKSWDKYQILVMHVLGSIDSWEQVDQFLHTARQKGVKKLRVIFERRSYTDAQGEVRDLWCYLRGIMPADTSPASPIWLANETSATVSGIVDTPQEVTEI